MAVRTVVQIDEDRCDGCGLCVPGCAEGALQIVDGKAKLVNDVYCDGLGACLGECPRGAITLVDREAGEFDEKAVKERLSELGRETAGHDHAGEQVHGKEGKYGKAHEEGEMDNLACGCPGTLSRSLDRPKPEPAAPRAGGGCPGSRAQSFHNRAASSEQDQPGPAASRLGNWPVQIMLVPPRAPYLEGADLLIAADCAPFAYGDFHRRFLEGKALLVGCPKLDDTDIYLDKLTTIFRENGIRSIGVVYMEVPCCGGLVHLVKSALEKSGRRIPTTLYRIGIKGDTVEERALPEAAA